MELYPIVLIALGVLVLLLGNRLPVLGAAVGGLLGASLLKLFPGSTEVWVQLAVVGGLALLGFFVSGFARGIIDIVIQVVGALAGAGIVLGFLDLFNLDLGLLNWILAVVGGVVGFMVIRRGRRGSKDWGMIILASLVGALLVTRGLALIIDPLKGSILATLLVIVLAGAGIVFEGGLFRGSKDDNKDKKAAAAATATSVPPAAPAAPVTPPAAPAANADDALPDPPKTNDSA